MPKDFGAWFNSAKSFPDIDNKELPHNVREVKKDSYEAQCCCCDRWTELPVDISEIDDGYEHYCGGSPHCCP